MSKREKIHVLTVRISDCRVDTFTCGGKGGAGKDTNNSGVRIVHAQSGAVGECREERHQHVNKQRAWRRMAEHPKFRAWCTLQAAGGTKVVLEAVEAAMQGKNLKVEVRNELGQWIEVHDGTYDWDGVQRVSEDCATE